FGDGQPGHRFVQRLLQPGGQLRAGGGAARHQVILLAVGLARQRGRIDVLQTFGGQLLLQRRGGRAVGGQADGHGHELFGVGLVRGLGQRVAEQGSQTSRRGVGGRYAAGGQQALLVQRCAQRLGKG